MDTHVLLWWLEGNPRLGREARARIGDPETSVWVSAATAWEIAIKSGLGRLELPEPAEVFLPREMKEESFRDLPISVAHALAVRGLPRHHNDPFDRLLIAQAELEGLAVVTADRVFSDYGITVIRADS